MKIQDMPPKDVIEPSWFPIYEQNIDAVWRQLVRLNSTIFVHEKIFSFPFRLFLPMSSGSRIFWKLVESALFETCVLIMWQVGVDNVYKEGLTLQQLKNQIFKHLQNSDYYSQLNDAFKQGHYDRRISSLKEKISEIRHNYVAHYNLEKYVNPTPEQIKKRFLLSSELKKYQNTLNEYFDLLCFGIERATLPSEYHPAVSYPLGDDSRSDIERLLDNIARESSLLNLPENDPVPWEAFRQKLSDEDIQIINEYRTKFELPPV